MKYVYSEGVRARSKNHPKVLSGEMQLVQPYVSREGWKVWRYWLVQITNRWFHLLRRVPFLRGLISSIWCERLEWQSWAQADERDFLALIPWDRVRPDRAQRWERFREERSADLGSKWRHPDSVDARSQD